MLCCKKNGKSFWACWNSNFESHIKCDQVEGCVEINIIAEKFSSHLSNSYVSNSLDRANSLKEDYVSLLDNYCGLPADYSNIFDAELIGNIMSGLTHGKGAGLDYIIAEHLQYSHPIISTLLAKLYNLLMRCHYVPHGFGPSYTILFIKIKDFCFKAMTCDDFIGIAVSSILSEVFEHCILDKFESFLWTNANQFGFKKGLGCSHAIYTVKSVVDRFISNG